MLLTITTPKSIRNYMENWNKIDYQKIRSASINKEILDVIFCNGDRVQISYNMLLSQDANELFNDVTIEDYIITLHGSREVVIPWDKIRIVTDPKFANAMAKKAEESAKSVGLKIKVLREKKQIKSNDLASRAGVTPQTISRIEKGHTDVSFGTLRKILASMGYTLRDLAELELVRKGELSLIDLIKKMTTLGIGSSVFKKIVPDELMRRVTDTKSPLPVLLATEIFSYLNRVFKLENEGGFYSDNLVLSTLPFDSAYYKTPKRGNISQLRAYSHYAYYLAKLVSNVHTVEPKFEYPGDIEEFKRIFSENYREINLESVLKCVWDFGISVIPLNDSGLFHGASWNISNKHVIVLKQKSKSHARWIFDLLHELYHVFAHLEDSGTSVIEINEMDPFDNNDSLEEREANTFANQVILGPNSDKYLREVLEGANYQIELFKRMVIEVSRRHSINPEFLANNLAFRLQNQHTNWWGTANSFEAHHESPFSIAARILKERILIDSLQTTDKNILTSALNEN